MKKLFTLFFIFLSLTLNLTAQNLIAGWSGNGVTGDLSKPNLVGWTNTNYASIPWNTANASGGCRFRDAGVGFYTYPDTVVYDAAEKGFRAELKNDAKVYTMGTTNKYKVLNLGDSIGYLDMGPEVGKVIYNLNDYTMSAYYRVDADTTLLKGAGHFLWTFSNTNDAMKDRNGYIIGSLLDQSVSISPKFYEVASGNQALGYATPALQGDWHHLAYVQSGTSASIYIDGMSMGTAEITNLPSEVLPQPGRLGTLYNWIGRSNYISDKYLRKTLVYDFRIYNRALSDNEILTTELNVGEVIASLNTAYSEGITGVKDVQQSADKYKIFASQGKIKVTGLDARDKVEVFDIAGRKIKSAVQSENRSKTGIVYRESKYTGYKSDCKVIIQINS